jgi:YgiT-type zinc finger domain-containing protein
MSEDPSNPVIPCRECPSGRMHRQLVTYITWLGNELITVPDFPAWVCDVCGLRIYDGHALNRLSLLLSPNAGRPTQRVQNIFRQQDDKKSQPHTPE